MMQQTETYKLNLIDMDDIFSPQPINENMGKLETALSALGGADAALGERVTVLEAHKLAIGTYTGSATNSNQSQTVHLGFKPRFVFAEAKNGGIMFFATPGASYRQNLVITDNGFTVTNDGTYNPNTGGTTYVYLAVK